MKVLIINVSSHTGSTGKITKGLYDFLKNEGHEVMVGYRGITEERIDNADFVPLVSQWEFLLSVLLARSTGLEGCFSYFATRKLKRVVEVFKPDIVQLYNIHGNYVRSYNFLEYLKNNNVPVVYSMLDEFPYMGKCPYPMDCEKFLTECNDCPQRNRFPESWFFDQSKRLFHKKEKCYEGFERLIFTGPPFVCRRAKQSYLLKNKVVVELDEPFNFDSFYPRDTANLRKKLCVNEKNKVVVCASGMSARKKGIYFMNIASKLKTFTDIKFIFIGYKSGEWEVPENVTTVGFLSNPDELAEYMSIADAYVCTSEGDTTPSVCLCALGCGTPLIGFDYGGVVDCAPNKYGTYVPIGDLDAMADVICGVKKVDDRIRFEIHNYAVKRFLPEKIYNKQLVIYEQLLGK